MALYIYQAFKRGGSKVSGSMDGASAQEVRERVVRLGLHPISVSRAEQHDQGTSRPLWERLWSALTQPQITTQDVIFFTKQLSVLLKAGVPLLQALELLREQTEKSLQKIVMSLKDGISEGKSLAEGLERFPHAFSSTYIQLVRAGEASGKLETILDRLVLYLERRHELRRKTSRALRMPLIQLAAIFVVVLVILNVVVPQIATIFQDQKTPLPLATRFLIGLSHATSTYVYYIIGGVLLTALGWFWFVSTPGGRRMWDAFLLRLPIVGYFIRMGAVVEFCSTLGMLVESGVNLAEALTIVCAIIDNRILVDTLREARDNIIKQGRITVYLKGTGLFPPVALYLIRTGEESGQLAAMLTTVAQTYDQEVRDWADGLTDQIQPVMNILIGAIVGFLVMAIGKPIMGLADIATSGMKGMGAL